MAASSSVPADVNSARALHLDGKLALPALGDADMRAFALQHVAARARARQLDAAAAAMEAILQNLPAPQRVNPPKEYYDRALTFLGQYRGRAPRLWQPVRDLRAFVRSLGVMGGRVRGRREYWKYLPKALLRPPRHFGDAVHLAIIGHHFRRIAASL